MNRLGDFLKIRTPEDTANAALLFQKTVDVAGKMHRARVRILAGTDGPGFGNFPGFSLHDELNLLVRGGLTPMEALQTATLNPARFLGMGKSLGTIEKGKIADLILLEANPLADIRNTRRINGVVLNGRYLPKGTLQNILAAAEAAADQK